VNIRAVAAAAWVPNRAAAVNNAAVISSTTAIEKAMLILII